MKRLFYISFFVLMGCVEHYNKHDFDLDLLHNSKQSLFLVKPNNNGYIEKNDWPHFIRSLNPLHIRKTKKGIFIKLDEFWVEESGLFFPIGLEILDENSDPSYRLLDKNIYSYYIKS